MHAPPRPENYDKKVALVLQGGGALGSYQAGVYEALAQSEYPPDWVAGISIGAINAALIVGNAPEHRVWRLREFWETITCDLPGFPMAAAMRRQFAAFGVMMAGAQGFFAPRPLFDFAGTPKPLSYYSTDMLKATLEKFVDFDRINSREIHFSVAAVNVRTGNFAWFDNLKMHIRPEHVMASGALPPGFPPVEIDGEYFWDGGLVSNTPLQYVLDHSPRRSRLVFQVDLFSARGKVPTDLDEVAERDKDIRYSSRTRAGDTAARRTHDLRNSINALLEMLPPELRATREARHLYEFGCITTMDIAQIIYRPEERQGASKDYEFSRATMLERWAEGFHDASATLQAAPWLTPMPPGTGTRSFDVQRRRHHG